MATGNARESLTISEGVRSLNDTQKPRDFTEWVKKHVGMEW